MNSQDLPSLRRIPDLLIRHRRRRALAGTVRLALFLAAGQALLLALLGWFSLRHPLDPTWLQAMAWSYAVYLVLPAAFWLGWRARGNSPAALARELDKANPSAPDPFRTCLSLDNHEPSTLAQLDRMLAAGLPALSMPRPRLFPGPQRMALAGGLLACAGAAILTGRPGEFLRRAAAPWHTLDRLPILRFHWETSRRTVGLGDTVVVRGGVEQWMPGQPVFAHVRSAAGESRFPLSLVPGPAASAAFAFAQGPVEGDFSLHFAGANGRSPTLKFKAVPPPFLARVQAVLTPPAYTRLKPDTLPQGVTHFPVLPGTRVLWLAEADRDLRRLVWTTRPAESAPGAAGDSALPGGTAPRADTLGPGRQFRPQREVRTPMAYAYWLEDEDGIRSRATLPFLVDLVPDQPPEIDLLAPEADQALDRDFKLPLAARVQDDFGVSSLKLVWRIVSDGVVRAEGRRDCRDWLRAARSGLVAAVWNLDSLELRPENVLEFHLEASDNDTVNGPKTTRSVARALRLPSVQEVLAASRKQEQNAVASLKSAIQREKQLLRKLEREGQPREEIPSVLSEYEINRIMVDDPRQHAKRTEAALAQAQARKPAGSAQRPGAQPERTPAEAGARELQDFLKKSEPSLPKGNQGILPPEERRKNLENLLKAQREQEEKLASLRDKVAKQADNPPLQARLEEAARELKRNIEAQADLQKQFDEQDAQAKAKQEMAEQSAQEQMRMAEDTKAALQDIQKAIEQGQRNGLLPPELLEKMKKVQDLLKEVLPDSLQKMLEQRVAGQEVDPKELRDQLKKMMDKHSEMSENLDRALAMLEQLRERKRLQELEQVLGELQAREKALAKRIPAAEKGASDAAAQGAEQKAIQKEAQKAMSDIAAQAGKKPELQELLRKLQEKQVHKDMQEVREGLAAKSKPGKDKAASSAKSAAAKLGEMASMLGEAAAGMDNSVDLTEANEILQESLALSRLQLLIRSGAAKRAAEGWEGEEAVLYGKVAQTAQWLNERVRVFAAKVPFIGASLSAAARNCWLAARETAEQYRLDNADKALAHNQALSRELLKLIKMAQNSPSNGAGGGSGSPSPGAGQGQGQGDLAGQLKGMSGKQMAINQATYQLLQAMLDGRRPGGRTGQGETPGGQGQSGQGKDGQGQGQGQGEGGEGEEGSLPGVGNRQGELGEQLESLAEGAGEEGAAAQKLRQLAAEARQLEEDLRKGRFTPEELRKRQERFQSRLLEASQSLEERGMSEKREAETGHGRPAEVPDAFKAVEEGRLLELLRQARRNARSLPLSGPQRKYLDEYYESLLTR